MSEEGRKGSLLGVLAYALVPGERRVRAAGHFRKAGFEALKGVGALMRPDGPGGPKETVQREQIEIE
jgi:hypothetical protein